MLIFVECWKGHRSQDNRAIVCIKSHLVVDRLFISLFMFKDYVIFIFLF